MSLREIVYMLALSLVRVFACMALPCCMLRSMTCALVFACMTLPCCMCAVFACVTLPCALVLAFTPVFLTHCDVLCPAWAMQWSCLLSTAAALAVPMHWHKASLVCRAPNLMVPLGPMNSNEKPNI